jgi:hypothetical protein
MKINPRSLASWLIVCAMAVLIGSFAPPARAGLLQIQNNPVSFGGLYWGNPTNWDNLHIPHFQPNPPGGGSIDRSINFISMAHDNSYFYVRVNFNEAPPFNGSDFYMWLDTDLNPATGSRDFSGNGAIGSEYVINGAALIQNPAAWNFAGWVNWDQNPWTSGSLPRDVIFSIDRSVQLPGVNSFYLTYQLFNSTAGTNADWYPESADTLTGSYFEYTTLEITNPLPAVSSVKYGQLIAAAGPLAYYRLSETNAVAADTATNGGSVGATGNGAYTTGARHPVTGAVVGDADTAAHFSAVNTNSTDGGVPVIVPWPEQPMIRELWDNVAAGNLNGKGDGTSSTGFASGSTWQVNNGRIMKIYRWGDVNTPPGPPYSLGSSGELYADNSDIGGLSSVWDTSAWATRQLASSTQINFGADGDYWITVRIDNAGDTAMGVGLANGGTGSAQFIGVGAMWNNAGGGAANNSVYITDGTLGTDSPYTIRVNGPAGAINGPGLLVAHLTTSSSGAGILNATVFLPNDVIPTDPSTIVWQATYSFNNSMTATHLVAWLNGDTSVGNGYLDAIRVTTNYAAMFQGQINPAGSFTVEAWLRPTINGNAGNAQSPLYNRDPNDTSANRVGWDFFQRDASVGYNFRMFNGNAHNKVFDITGGPYTVGAWGHLVAVYDAVAGSATLYLNGVQVVQSTSANGTFAPNGTFPLSIGCYSDASQNPFTGDIDEVAVYTNALSPAQVLAHYQNGTNASRSLSYSTLVKADGAVEYLRLDEPAKNIAHNSGSLGATADGIFNLKTIAGHAGPRAPADGGFEASNTAAYFNGGSSYLELGNPDGLNFFGQLTLEAWIQPSVTPAASGGYGDIISHGYDEDYNEVALRVDNSSGTPQYSISTYRQWFGEGASAVAATNSDFGTGAWVHLVGTFDGANWNLYRNGVLLASAPDTTGSLTVTNGNWAIGARGRWAHMDVLGFGLDRQFQGTIDEPAIYNRALSPSEVLAHYLVGSANGPAILATPSGAHSLTLTWPVGTLQQADNVNGPYSDVGGATSPYPVSTAGVARKYYRLKL